MELEEIGLAKNHDIGDKVWIKQPSTGLLMRAVIVHQRHVPRKHIEELQKYESNLDNVIWAKQELGGSRFVWHAIYADAPAYIKIGGIKEEDKFTSHHSLSTLYRN